MEISTKYDIRETVYLKTDPDEQPRIITGIIIKPGYTIYQLSCGPGESHHYDFEFQREKLSVLETEE